MGKRKANVMATEDSSDDVADDDYVEEAFWNKDGTYQIHRTKRYRPQGKEDQIYGIWADPAKVAQRVRPKKMDAFNLSSMSLNFVKGEKLDITKEEKEEAEKQAKWEEKKKAESTAKKAATPKDKKGVGDKNSKDPFNLEDMLPQSFGSRPQPSKSEQRFKKKKEPSLDKPTLPIRKDRDWGDWEKYTSGFASKMMKKMGFKGRLGKDETGRSNPVTAFKRGKGLGLGFAGPEKIDKSARNAVEEREEIEQNALKREKEQEKKRKKLYEKVQDGKSVRPTYMTAKEALEKKNITGPKVIETIVDFSKATGPEIRSLGSVNTERWIPTKEEHVVCPQFLHNIRLIVDITEHELENVDKHLKEKLEKKKALEESVQKEAHRGNSHESNIDRLEKILEIINQMLPPEKLDYRFEGSRKINDARASISPLPAKELAQLFQKLQTQFHREYNAFGLQSLAISLIFPKVKMELTQWDPFQTPGFPYMLLRDWRPLLMAKKTRNQTSDLYTLLIEETILNRVRASVCNMISWAQPGAAIQLFKCCKEYMPTHLYEDLLSQLVMPKLKDAIASWIPADGILIHQWILPWKPVLEEERMASLYPLIRRQIGRSLVRWQASDPFALKLVRPWDKILSREEMDELYIKCICPKLDATLRSVFGASLNNSATDPFDDVMSWEPLVPHHAFVMTMRRGFFPSWLDELHKWISRPGCDLDAIATWYIGWKASFSPRMIQNKMVIEHLNIALDMMACVLQNKELPGMDLIRSENDALFKTQKVTNKKLKAKLPRPRQSSRPVAKISSLKQTLELLATKHELEFYPKNGRTSNGFQIYLFGKKTVYFDEKVKVIYSRDARSKEWKLASVDKLLADQK